MPLRGLDPSPVLGAEYQRIRDSHPTLASTGCTGEFCQAGRLIHHDEPRVGENRAIHIVEQEAEGFLNILHAEGFYEDDIAFEYRYQEVLQEIRDGAIVQQKAIGDAVMHVTVGCNWKQTAQELEFGVRRAWRNSRKCIMRSHSDELKLCDLRGITSSVQMVAELLKMVSEAFNGGNILPTVFVFPPRQPGHRGPMFWNHQILQFAGYENADGSILGDPSSVRLTNAIIELGWIPPVSRSRWDLLPLVALAEGERPAFAEIPANLRALVDIRHPQYNSQFEKLGLKWVSFPALTRLGFDIGGVQYTAAPFIGWFMDAEIGVRNLPDPFRYNVLPDIVDALDLAKGKLGRCFETFEDLPEYEKLSLLSRAQLELNLAVNWSFLKAKVTMTDSLTASMKWCQFDDAFKQKNGFRLPSDPYWLAPPQGSIIPVWHRGGAPNYQPKPMIARHVQDPIKAWEREKHLWLDAVQPLAALIVVQEAPIPAKVKSDTSVVECETRDDDMTEKQRDIAPLSEPVVHGRIRRHENKTVAIYFCSGGIIAEKLANKLQQWTTSFLERSNDVSCKAAVEPLESLNASDLRTDRILLLIVSSTGRGDIPANGLVFQNMCQKLGAESRPSPVNGFRFAVFGNGDSRYSSTYNQAAHRIDGLLKQIGGLPLTRGIWEGDTAAEPLPLRALSSWWEKLRPSITSTIATSVTESKPAEDVTAEDAIQRYDSQQEELLSRLKSATLFITAPKALAQIDRGRSLLLSMNVGSETYKEMSCVQVLPFNAPTKVVKTLRALCVKGNVQMNLVLEGDDPTFFRFLSEFVDLERPFLELEWLKSIPLSFQRGLTPDSLSRLSVVEVLERVVSSDFAEGHTHDYCLQRDICLDMPLLNVKTYSVASSPSYATSHEDVAAVNDHEVQIMVKVNKDGRFSDTFLNDRTLPAALKYRFVDSKVGPQMRENYLAPFIIVATGAGFGPVRSLLQWRIATARDAIAAGQPSQVFHNGISLFLGLKACDKDIVEDAINEARSYNILDLVNIVLSNPEKTRVYEKLRIHEKLIKDKLFDRHIQGYVFVCTGNAAAKGTKNTLEEVIGGSVGKILGDRYLEEVF